MRLNEAIRLRQMYRNHTASHIRLLRLYLRKKESSSLINHEHDEIKHWRERVADMEDWIELFQREPHAQGRYLFPHLSPAEHKMILPGTKATSERTFTIQKQKYTILFTSPEPCCFDHRGKASAYKALVMPIPERIFPL